MTGPAPSARLHNGVNLQPSYYNGGNVTFGWNLMRQSPKIKTVRIEIEPNRALQARDWVQQACGQGYSVIATYHKFSVLGTNDAAELQAAGTWWQSNYASLINGAINYTAVRGDTLSGLAAKYYGDATAYGPIYDQNRSALRDPHTIRVGQVLTIPARNRSFTINLMNEWGDHNLQAQDYAIAYNAAISTVRSVYANKPIIIDAPGWGQETAVLAAAVKGYNTGGVSITDPNVMLSVHIYRQAYVRQKRAGLPSGPLDTGDLDDLASAERPCIVGEFGPGNPGGASWTALVAHAKSRGWPVLGWAWNGDGGSMNMVTPAWRTNPAPTTYTPSAYFPTIYAQL